MLMLHISLPQLPKGMKPSICHYLAKIKLWLMLMIYCGASGASLDADYATILV